MLETDPPTAAAGALHPEQTGAHLNSPIAALRGLTATVSPAGLSERLPQIATAVLAIALAVELGFLVLGFMGNGSIVAPAVPTAAPAASAARSLDLPSIVNAHMFGIAAPVPGAAIDPNSAPNTTMNLVLAGTIATQDPQHGLAIIGESAANAKVYSVGEAVAGGATLHAVYTDRVLLERGGVIEALSLPRQSLGGPGRRTVGQAPSLPGAASQGTTLAENVRRLIAQDPGALTQIMRAQPVFLNGQQRGFRVYPGTNRQQFAKLGLMPGDLVTAVNGTPLDDPARGNEIFRTIGSSDSVHVTIERNGQRQELTLNMAQIANQAEELETGNAGGASGSGMIPMNQVPQMPAEEEE